MRSMTLLNRRQEAERRTSLKLEVARSLHAHMWQRLMWYRDEFWRVTFPFWATIVGVLSGTGFAAKDIPPALMPYPAAALTAAVGYMATLHFKYIHTIFLAIKFLNDRLERRERTVVELSELASREGYRTEVTQNEEPDVNFGLWNPTRPCLLGLQIKTTGVLTLGVVFLMFMGVVPSATPVLEGSIHLLNYFPVPRALVFGVGMALLVFIQVYMWSVIIRKSRKLNDGTHADWIDIFERDLVRHGLNNEHLQAIIEQRELWIAKQIGSGKRPRVAACEVLGLARKVAAKNALQSN